MQTIQWYPGHIAKAQRKLKESLKLVDLVIEMVDSRLPISSHFKFIEDLIQNKEKVVVLNKCDLVDRDGLNKLLKFWEEREIDYVCTDLNRAKDIKNLKTVIDKHHQKLNLKMKKKGLLPRNIRVMVLGLPNIGKSSLINRLVSKKKVKVGNKPGVTRSNQWIRIGKNIELLDTPGIIPPKFESQYLAMKFVIIDAVSVDAFEPIETVREIINYLKEEKPEIIKKIGIEDFTVEKYGESRNFLREKGEVDTYRAAKTFLKDLREGKLGQIILD